MVHRSLTQLLQYIGVDLDGVGHRGELEGREMDAVIVAEPLEVVREPIERSGEVAGIDSKDADPYAWCDGAAVKRSCVQGE